MDRCDPCEIGRLVLKLVETPGTVIFHVGADEISASLSAAGGRRHGVGRTVYQVLLEVCGEPPPVRHCSACDTDVPEVQFSTGDRWCLPCRRRKAVERRAARKRQRLSARRAA